MLPAGFPLAVVRDSAVPARALDPIRPALPKSPAPNWPDTPVARREALALLQRLDAELLANPSATLTLERWCTGLPPADPAQIVAVRMAGQEGEASAAVRALLAAQAGAPVRHRRVKLRCGDVTLSEADNYYLPERLTPEMNAILDTTDAPFGKVVHALGFRRRTLSSRLLWTPLPPEGEMAPRPMDDDRATPGPLAIPAFVLEHRAVLDTPDGAPFSALIERYTGGIFAFRRPPRR